MSYSWKGERILPSYVTNHVFAYHLVRYAFAVPYIKNRKVLDAACGAGYGAFYLAEKGAAQVHGIDIENQAIAFAKKAYGIRLPEVLSFQVMDIENLHFENDCFDTVVSFETLEHLPRLEAYFSELKRVLKPGGHVLISVPDKRSNKDACVDNPFHFNEQYLADFQQMMEANFAEVTYFMQLLVPPPSPQFGLISALKKIIPFEINLGITRFLKQRGMLPKDDFQMDNFDDFEQKNQEMLYQYRLMPVPEKLPEPTEGRVIFLALATKQT